MYSGGVQLYARGVLLNVGVVRLNIYARGEQLYAGRVRFYGRMI